VKRLAGLLAGERPVDLDPPAVGLTVPDPRFPLQGAQIRYPPLAQTLPGVEAEFDLRLVQPASVLSAIIRKRSFLSAIRHHPRRGRESSVRSSAQPAIG
jgi:hypothetical protein